jgi:hypothetical protein
MRVVEHNGDSGGRTDCQIDRSRLLRSSDNFVMPRVLGCSSVAAVDQRLSDALHTTLQLPCVKTVAEVVGVHLHSQQLPFVSYIERRRRCSPSHRRGS